MCGMFPGGMSVLYVPWRDECVVCSQEGRVCGMFPGGMSVWYVSWMDECVVCTISTLKLYITENKLKKHN